MDAPEQPQIYLISPPAFELSRFGDDLAGILDATPVACFRLAMASDDEDEIARAADNLREICHARDVAIVIADHFRMAGRLGLDGCHLSDGARLVRDVRKELGQDAIVGSFCGNSRHSGLAAGEAGVDYVSFGPASGSALGDGSEAESDLFRWWSEMIEVPVVAEGGLTLEKVEELAGITDFLGVGREIWSTELPAEALKALLKPIL